PDDAVDVAVAKTGCKVAAVVAGKRPAKLSLRRARTGAIEALFEHRLHRAEVAAGVEGLRDRQPEAPQIADVDLRQPDAEDPSLSLEGGCRGDGLHRGAGLAFECATDDADGVGVE